MKILTQDTVRQTSYTYVNKTTTSHSNSNQPSFGYYQFKHSNKAKNVAKTILAISFISKLIDFIKNLNNKNDSDENKIISGKEFHDKPKQDNILQGTVLYELKEENDINNNNKKMYKYVPKADVTKQPVRVLYPKKFPRRIKAADGKVYKRVVAPCNESYCHKNMMYIPKSKKKALSFESDYYYADRSKCPYNVGKKEVVTSEKFNKMPIYIMIGQNLFEQEQTGISDNMIGVLYMEDVDLTRREGVIHKEDFDKFPPIICGTDGKYYLRDLSENYGKDTFIRFKYMKIS